MSIGEEVGDDVDCSVHPVGETSGIRIRFGPPVAAASLCIGVVVVDGRRYHVGNGRWLDDDAIDLREFAPITQANDRVHEPVAYAIDGVNPNRLLLNRGTDPIRQAKRRSKTWSPWGRPKLGRDRHCAQLTSNSARSENRRDECTPEKPSSAGSDGQGQAADVSEVDGS